MATDVRILLLADSHVGFDLTLAPRVARRRRGHDFLANHSAALEPAVRGEVDLVVHAGDVFDRPSIAPSIAYQALEPLRRVAESGVPVFVVPGNHDGSCCRTPDLRRTTTLTYSIRRAPSSLTCAGRGSRWWGFPMSDKTCGRASPSFSSTQRFDGNGRRCACCACITVWKAPRSARATSRSRLRTM